MRRSFCSVLFAVSLFVGMSVATASAAPVTWERVDVVVHAEDSGTMMLVSGQLPEGASLPAQAELSVPAGSQIQWLGEILGGAPSADPALAPTKATVAGADVYRFTLTKSHKAQAEIPAKSAIAFDGTNYDADLKWISATAVPEVRLSVRVPNGAQVIEPAAGASTVPAEAGYSYYTKTFKDVKAGDKLTLAMAYVAPAAAATGAAPSNASPIPTMVLLTLIGAAVVGLIVIVRRKMAGTRASDPSGAPSVRNAPTTGATAPVRTTSTDSRPEDGSAVLEAPSRGPRINGAAKRTLFGLVIVGVIVVGALFVGRETTKPQVTGDTITKVFSPGQPCANATVQLTLPPGADPVNVADTLFVALKPITGLNTVALNTRTSTLEVGYCESSGSEAAIRQALAPTGMVAEGGAPAQQ